MNGYAAVYEPVVQPVRTFGGLSGGEAIGTVHATDADASGQPGPYTLCDMDAHDIRPVPGDIPADTFPTWYPPGGHVRSICRACDRLAGA
ncbi:hypothetical protein [Streptomyces sp. NPDC049915]|uniref:hypothetical protein n=1 Tax=Streptomyces sp. NPDC049915 TaxID=3155510 RepID=UPI00343F6B6B